MQKTFCDRCGKYIDKQWKADDYAWELITKAN